MIAYLFQALADISAPMSYSLAKKSTVFFSSVPEAFAYSNFYVILFIVLLSPYLYFKHKINVFDIKRYTRNKNVLFATFLSVLSAFVKTGLIGYGVKQLQLKTFATICPFITLMLCHFFIKDQKISKNILISFVISFVGFLLFNNESQMITGKMLKFVFVYVVLNAVSDFLLKLVSKNRGFEMMLFDNLMYTFVSFVIFVIAQFNESFTKKACQISKFDYNKLIGHESFKHLFVIASLSVIAHNCKMLSFKVKHIAGLLIFSLFFKMLATIIATYVDHKTLPTLNQYIGLLLILIGTCIFALKKKK